MTYNSPPTYPTLANILVSDFQTFLYTYLWIFKKMQAYYDFNFINCYFSSTVNITFNRSFVPNKYFLSA